MDVMVVGVVCEDNLEGIKGQFVSTMIVNGLHCRDRKEEHCLSCGHSSQKLCNTSTERVEEEPFERVVVERAEGVRDVKPVMNRVKGLVQVSVIVHSSMEKVLPCINNEALGVIGQREYGNRG